jgi:Spy/CpxP family protein refolding chaperone
MNRTRWMHGLAPAVLVMIAGCGSSTPPPAEAPEPAASQATTPAASASAAASAEADFAAAGPAEADAEDDESSADLKEHHRHHHHGGFAMFIAMSLDSLNTTPEQNAAITKIQAEMHAKMQPAHDAEKGLLSVLADGVGAGKIDRAKVDAAIAKVSSTAAGVHEGVVESLNQLHATLTPEQRTALVDKVEAHFEVWHEANGEDEPAAKDAHGGQLGKLAKELALTPDQVEKIRTSFKTSIGGGKVHFDSSEAEAHLKALGTAFEAETFDAKTLTTGGAANAHIATWGATRMARFYEAANPVLTPDQRKKLAESLHRHANYKRTETET